MTDLEFQHAIAQWAHESRHTRLRGLNFYHHLEQQRIAYDNGMIDLVWMHFQRIVDLENQ